MAVRYQDYYATLGVPRGASESEIRTAYRRLAREHHPDVNPGNREAEERFKDINEAYEVLSDPDKRRRYDEVGEHWREYEQWQRAQEAAGRRAEPSDFAGFAGAGARGGPGGFRYQTVSPEDFEDLFGEDAGFSDFFETFFTPAGATGGFGGRAAGRGRAGRRAPRPRAGGDLEYPVEISLADAYRGTTMRLVLETPDGRTRTIEVTIPPGVRTGSRVRVAGQGGPGEAGGPPGDLYLVVTVEPDPRFERRGDDLYTEVRAPLTTMLLGGEVRVPTPDGRSLALKVPPGTQDGRLFRLRGQGMPHLGRPDQRGDLHAAVHVQLPERLSTRERELVEELGRAMAGGEPAGTR